MEKVSIIFAVTIHIEWEIIRQFDNQTFVKLTILFNESVFNNLSFFNNLKIVEILIIS